MTVGAWGTDVSMTPDVVAVRQNLVPMVAGGQPTAQATSPDWQAWGATCGVTSCSSTVSGIENQWRSGAGVTADGALVYIAGPGLTPLQVAQLLVQAGVIRGMELDINPNWPVLATYDPPTPNGLAAPSNGGSLQPSSVQNATDLLQPGMGARLHHDVGDDHNSWRLSARAHTESISWKEPHVGIPVRAIGEPNVLRSYALPMMLTTEAMSRGIAYRVSCASGEVELADRQGPTARILSCNSEERSQPGQASG